MPVSCRASWMAGAAAPDQGDALALAQREGDAAEHGVPNVVLEVDVLEADLVLEGLATHFANIEDTTDHSFAQAQLRRLHEALELLAARGSSRLADA